MNLLLLRKTSHFAAYYDTHNDWLFADWQGYLTLAAVQAACGELADVCRQRTYARVLNSNAQVAGAPWDITAWLAHTLLPLLQLAGVKQLAWVCAPTPRGHNIAQTIAGLLPHPPITVFDDLELAVAWLQRTHWPYSAPKVPQRHVAAASSQAGYPTQALAHQLVAQRPIITPAATLR